MGVYVYCLAAADLSPPPELRGIDGSPVTARTVDPFLIWCSALDARPEPSIDRVRRHNDVVERASSLGAALPVRFGQWAESDRALARSVADARDEYATALDRVAGAVEFAVSVIRTGAATDRPATRSGRDRSSGRAYMESLARRAGAKRERAAHGDEIAERLRAAVGELVREERVRPGSSAPTLVEIAHLVARDDVDAYRRMLYAFEGKFPGSQFLLTGPWPPYSFVG